ncbi:MAG: hypothetical protein IPG71_08370 [bacterium]|nr:hypothetical protein [bacterium]
MTLGTSQSLGALARVFGPPSGTTLFQFAGPSAPYWVSGLMIAAVTWVRLVPRTKT